MDAYCGFARLTGCRPRMALNDRFDHIDPTSEWLDKAPLTNRNVRIDAAGFKPAIQGGGERKHLF